eukprot:1157283-Pelagomonas_calceolata.AAC.4
MAGSAMGGCLVAQCEMQLQLHGLNGIMHGRAHGCRISSKQAHTHAGVDAYPANASYMLGRQ